jgi:thiol-disulfide isomerase/thioredoxin
LQFWSLSVSALKSAFAALIALVMPASALAEDEAQLAAVLSYADWCASCRVVDAKMEAVRAQRAFDGVRFLTVDYTHRNTRSYFAQADAAGVGAAMRAHFQTRIRTGMVLLIDVENGAVIGEIRRDATLDEITYELWRAAAEAGSS